MSPIKLLLFNNYLIIIIIIIMIMIMIMIIIIITLLMCRDCLAEGLSSTDRRHLPQKTL